MKNIYKEGNSNKMKVLSIIHARIIHYINSADAEFI